MGKRTLLAFVICGMASAATVQLTPREARTVSCDGGKNVPIAVGVGMTTVINLPHGELVKQVFGGDDDWNINGNKRKGDQPEDQKPKKTPFLAVEPTVKNLRTVITLIGSGKTHCTFVATEAGLSGSKDFDTNITVEGLGENKDSMPFEKLEWVPKDDVQGYKDRADRAEKDADLKVKESQESVQKKIDQFKATYPEKLRFDYMYDQATAEKIGLRAMWSDGERTFAFAPGTHLFSLYELSSDNKPVQINMNVHNGGLYEVPDHMLKDGYFAFGLKKKDHLEFHKRAEVE